MPRLRPALCAALVALVPSTLLVAVAPAQADFTASISGTVSAPEPGLVEVDLFRLDADGWNEIDDAILEPDGSYLFVQVPAGSYRVQARYGSLPSGVVPAAPAWYGGASFEDADTISLDRGDDVDDRDISMGPGATISGRVTSTDPNWPVEGSVVSVTPVLDDGLHSGSQADVAPDGSYAVRGLAPGRYEVEAVPDHSSQLARTAPPVELTLGANQAAGGVTLTMAPGQGFGGRVTAEGQPLEYANVHAYRVTPRGLRYEDSRETTRLGFYVFAGLRAGTYVVTGSPEYRSPDAATWGSVRVNGVVLDGGDPPDVPLALPRGATVSGRVVGPSGEGVPDVDVVLDWQGSDDLDWSEIVTTGPDGSFSAQGLTPGSYVPRLREERRGEYLVGSGSAVSVASGGSGDASFTVQRGGRVSGVTSGPNGPLGDVMVLAYRAKEADWWLEDVVDSAANGSYELRGLRPGTYRLCFRKYTSGIQYYGECWDNVPGSEAGGKDVQVAANQVVTGISPRLDRDGVPLTNTVRPTLSGSPSVGSTLSVTTGTWDPQPTGYDYTWYRGEDGIAIRGATGPSYVVTAADAGEKLEVRVTAQRNGYRATHAFADPVTVAAVPITNLRRPTITGTARVGRTLTGSKGGWADARTLRFRYAWFAGSTRLSGQTGTTLRLPASTRGKRITFRVTATRTGSTPVTAKSAATAAVRR